MEEKRNLGLFYASIWLLAITAIIHIVLDPPHNHTDVITNLAFMGAVVFLLMMTLFVFRPQIRRISTTMDQMKLLETVISSANDGIIITKANLESPGPEIIYVNQAFTQISGYSWEDAVGKSPHFLQNEFTKRETLDAMKQALIAGKPFKDELLNSTKDGKHYWLEISIVPVKNSEGVVTHFAAIERDISKRKEEEMERANMWVQLKRANLKAEAMTKDLQESLIKAEEANKAKSDFLANMSHELRTPMNGVLGMAHLLNDTDLNREQKELVNTINSSGENLLMLLNDILDFSKIEAGALVLEHIAYPFIQTMHQTSNLLRPEAEKKGISLIVDSDPDVPAYVWGDPGRIRQIITNLVGNAVKFTERGYVHLSARLQEDDGQNKIYVSVQDTGMGIPQHKLSEIFEKFTQADASITRKYGGTGLGLAITKQLVSLMGGEIGVESAEGKGSTFWFAIPCDAALENDVTMQHTEHQMRVPAHEHRTPVAEAQVLLVDDYNVNQVFAEKLLRKFGFKHIDLADNGVEAIEKYRTHRYDIIFMDCQMPELDGYQATSKLRLLEEGMPAHTPIVAMTANAMMGDREKCLKAGMDDYLSKPLRAEHLKKIIETWFIMADDKSAIVPERTASPTIPQAEEPPVDMEQLRMFTDGDQEEEQALFELFLTQAQDMMVILERSTKNEMRDGWKSAAHRFKGSSGNLGAMKLHQLCKHAEMHYDASEVEKKETLVKLGAEINAVAEFAQHMRAH